MAATFRQTPLRRFGNILITPLARLGLAGKRTHVLTAALSLLITLLPIRRAVRLRPGDALRYA